MEGNRDREGNRRKWGGWGSRGRAKEIGAGREVEGEQGKYGNLVREVVGNRGWEGNRGKYVQMKVEALELKT